MASPKESKKAKTISVNNTYSPIAEDMPDEVVEKIISYFPLKECTRAALVSKRFTNSWKFCSNLCFEVDEQRLPRDAYASLVDRVLDQHLGPKIERLVVAYDPTGQENRVIDWIRKVVAKGVEELILDFSNDGQAFPFSSHLIDVTPIRVLKLNYCELGFSEQLSGLRFLKTLVLKNIRLMNNLTDTIFSNCLLLENLEFVNCSNNTRLQILAGHLKHFKSLKMEGFKDLISVFINAPTLKSLCYNGDICRFNLNWLFPCLDVASFYFRGNRNYKQLDGVEGIIMSVTFCLQLTICSTILEGLSHKMKNFEYKEFQFCLWRLKELTLFLGGSSYDRGTTFVNPCDIVYFLKKCPLIENIYIDVDEQRLPRAAYASLVDHVLDQHLGPKVERLAVAYDPTGQENRVIDWIQKVVNKGVEELILDFTDGDH
ncbi:hypothetical protein ACH5RR_017794 [Cinchona calisaya]|uniref:F-box domain-containing protein n=1 Tax=Cinchona calisaya TaxID=153742 RepID=A0ABD2ZN86_9GENT